MSSPYVCFDYREAQAFFAASAARRTSLKKLTPQFICRLHDVNCAEIYVYADNTSVTHYLRRTDGRDVALLTYDRWPGCKADEEEPLGRLFATQVRDVLLQAHVVADTPIAQRLDAVLERLDTLPHCGAGRDVVAAEARFNDATTHKR